MNSIVKFAKTIRNNWKKSTFAAVALFYGFDYARSKYEISQMMRVYCEECKALGEKAIPVEKKPRHLTVILNPASKDGKGTALYEKYAAPLLHLAGIRVSVIKTEGEGQIKVLMDVMDNTDAVLVAGGNGTLQEAVTGLCRREDADSAIQRFPIGIIPIGRNNTVAKKLFWGRHQTEAQYDIFLLRGLHRMARRLYETDRTLLLLAESAMAVVRGETRPMDIVSISSESGKPVYGLASLEWGIYRDVNSKIQKYWYFGPLKGRMAYFFASFKQRNPSMEAALSYTLPCDGCSKCFTASNLSSLHKDESKPLSRRWWHSFIPRRNDQTASTISPLVDYSKIINDECGIWHLRNFKMNDFLVESSNNLPHCKQTGQKALVMKIGLEDTTSLDFLLQGWKRVSGDESTSTDEWREIMAIKDLQLEINVPEGLESWFSIDNENYEVRAIHVSLISNKIQVFCS